MSQLDVFICEVGPRDGLQNAHHLMPTEAKKAWISALAAAGLREIEVGSFVPAKVIPAMADTGEVVAHAKTIAGLKVVALAPNFKGFQRALESGAHKITFPVSASHQHSVSNVRMTPDEMVAQVRQACELRLTLPAGQRPEIEGAVATAFGCTLQGEVPEDEVVRIAKLLADAGVDSVALADTVGYANPAQMKRLYRKVKDAVGAKLDGVHLHNTRGLGLANALAAYEEGARAFDSSMGGLGGCPFAPGASGNVVTEDLAFMFESMGLRTGIDFDALLRAREILVNGIPEEPVYGHFAGAGLPKGFRRAAQEGVPGKPAVAPVV
ncbi:MAG: hydroxymethylglutaryl-CoA lyase [Proteobacteria bacterium]|nr:hydroxymethylglutaryl-CoA lyase [Pseudomonadota bacterium]